MGERELPEAGNFADFHHSGYPRQRTPWGVSDCLAIILLVALSSIVLTSLSARLLNRMPLPVPGSNGRDAILILVSGYIQSLFFIVLVLLCVLVKYRAPLAEVGLTRFPWKDIFYKGILGGLVVLVVVFFLLSIIISLLHKTPPPQPLTELLIASRNRGFLVLSFLLVGVLAPLGEEVYFRGFVYPAIRWRLGMLPAVLVSSAFFGALHFDLFRFLPLTAGGAALALICERTGSLLPSIFAHSTWNITMLLLIMAGRLS